MGSRFTRTQGDRTKRRWPSTQSAALALIVAFGLIAGMHLLILVGVLPSTLVWGGAIQRRTQMFALEGVALGVAILFMAVVAARAGWTRWDRYSRALGWGAWLIVAYLLLNTIANLAASGLERWLFAPVTLVLALCALRLALDEPADAGTLNRSGA